MLNAGGIKYKFNVIINHNILYNRIKYIFLNNKRRYTIETINTPNTLEYKRILKTLYVLLFLVFYTKDLLYFFIFFELSLIPLILLILIYGNRDRKIQATIRLTIYTIISGLLMLSVIIYYNNNIGTTNIFYLTYINTYISNNITNIIWWLIMINFLIKIPSYPFYTWLPEAHTEASTTGSIILAAILLKIGTYGIYKYNYLLFTLHTNIQNIPIIKTITIITILLTCTILISIVDIKKFIAYSSILHLNFSLLAFTSLSHIGTLSLLLTNITHGIVSTGLFYLNGCLYTRYHTRYISYYQSLYQYMPIFSFFFILILLNNISLPFTSNFISELLTFISIYHDNKYSLWICSLFIFLLTISTYYILIQILYGTSSLYISTYNDLNIHEFIIISILIFISFFIGIFPNYLISFFIL